MAPPIEIHDRDIELRKQGIQQWRIAANDKKSLVRFLEELELGKVNKGRKITSSRQCKYLDVLRTPLEFFGKPVAKIALRDIESFEKALSTGMLHSRKGQSYGHATMVDMRRALRTFLKWRLGAAKALKLTDWFDTRDRFKTPDYLKEVEVERLFKACRSAEERFLIGVLFDSGARATELHNIRVEDIELPEGQGNFVRLAPKEEYSKTKGRTISLFWKHSLDAVRDYLRLRQSEGIKSGDPVFTMRYDAARMFLHRLGKRVLGRSIHYHLFRHSSATYYADKMNRQQLCIRYGWAFSSRMPDVYIARAGVDTQELDTKFAAGEIEKFKSSLTRVEQEARIKDERIKQLERSVVVMQKHFPLIARILEEHSSVPEIRAVIRDKQTSRIPKYRNDE